MGTNVRVMISKSHNIYTNLAWETWLYKNLDFTGNPHGLLLLWRNNPCVVIGRYQNPWREVHMMNLDLFDIPLARRNSGGGTVYHDLGNINFTFMTERSLYDRRRNLEFIVDVLRKHYTLPASVSKRDDILIEDSLKVSGTAAKLGRKSAYHHCTLLCNVDKQQLRSVLSPKTHGVVTNATASVPSPTVNLRDLNPSITASQLLPLFASEFLSVVPDQEGTVEYIDPSEHSYPGLEKEVSDLSSTDFILGGTPKFDIIREFVLPDDFGSSESLKFGLKIHVEKGAIVEGSFSGNLPADLLSAASDIVQALNGVPFGSAEMWQRFESKLKPISHLHNRLALDFMYHCILRALSLQE